MWARPARLRAVDVDRRLILGGSLAVLSAASIAVAGELAVRAIGLSGSRRAATGSHEVASFDPDAMPTVSWLNDSAPTTPTDEWQLCIDGTTISINDLRRRSTPLTAALDCTGGWFSEQRWDVVPISELLPADARSFEVASATGYRRIYAMSEASKIFVGVGYDGRDLRRGHGRQSASSRRAAEGRGGSSGSSLSNPPTARRGFNCPSPRPSQTRACRQPRWPPHGRLPSGWRPPTAARAPRRWWSLRCRCPWAGDVVRPAPRCRCGAS